MLLFLQYRKYINEKKSTLIYGKLLQAAPYKFQEEAIICLEILKASSFSLAAPKEEFKDERNPNLEEKQEEKFTLLISEVFSLIPIETKVFFQVKTL